MVRMFLNVALIDRGCFVYSVRLTVSLCVVNKCGSVTIGSLGFSLCVCLLVVQFSCVCLVLCLID